MGLRVLLALIISLLALPMPVAAEPREACFHETDTCVRGVFFHYWQANGGVPQLGLPITDAFQEQNAPPPAGDGRVHTVQYFERARLEHHLEFAGTDKEVLLGLLGREQYQARYADSPPPAQRRGGGQCFVETGRCLGGAFWRYWQANGGLRRHGFPITDEVIETGSDGQPRIVQYFERARFELHQAFASHEQEVRLGPVGSEQYQLKQYLANARSVWRGAADSGTRSQHEARTTSGQALLGSLRREAIMWKQGYMYARDLRPPPEYGTHHAGLVNALSWFNAAADKLAPCSDIQVSELGDACIRSVLRDLDEGVVQLLGASLP